MADLDVVAYVTRTSLSLGDLDLEDDGVYKVVTFHPGSITFARKFAESDHLHGRVLTHAKKETPTSTLVVRVYGSSASQLHTRIDNLMEAFTEQFRYRIHVELDGVEYDYYCEPADIDMESSAGWDKFSLMAFQQAFAISIPRNPTPTDGGF